ncbi:hypothetical protein [Vibrio sonorensis]|uniref:hypothetical protein n=1 Tax=Vibrio sonorensis TaxID=1004316 RepID=UPI0008DAF8ED|nr:hypothetical protein [Vibrio sonorensis]
MKEPLPELDEATKKVLLRVVIYDFTDYVSTCSDELLSEFFNSSDITQVSFFNEVMHNIEQILGVYWWKALEFISERTREIQQSVFVQPWES